MQEILDQNRNRLVPANVLALKSEEELRKGKVVQLVKEKKATIAVGGDTRTVVTRKPVAKTTSAPPEVCDFTAKTFNGEQTAMVPSRKALDIPVTRATFPIVPDLGMRYSGLTAMAEQNRPTSKSPEQSAEIRKEASFETVQPFRGEIVDSPESGKIVVVTGYHGLEKEWGQIVKEEFRKNVIDKDEKVAFLEIQDSPVETGEESPHVNSQIASFLQEVGNVEMVIDIHEHPGSQATRVRNQWSLTAEDEKVVDASTERIKDLRILPFDDYSRKKTGGQNIPYAISDPDLPQKGKEGYLKGQVTPQMQEAINNTLSFITNLANIQLKTSAKNKK